MRNLTRITADELNEHQEEINRYRNWGFILGYVYGYIHKGNLRHNCDNIISGLVSSNSFVSRIPDNLAYYTEDIDSLVDAVVEYINRWEMYARLFSDEKYAG